MLSRVTLALFALLALPLVPVFAGQIPVVNGVPGGAPKAQGKSPNRMASLVASPGVSAVDTTTPGKLRIVENSGVCETTKGVYQASGYGDIAANKSLFFWFFAARENPATAPVVLWINGGPGSSSMYGLFQEHGPCRISNDSTELLHNPYAWNSNANVIYLDQPVGAGFSHGTKEVGTTQQAAVDVYTFLQMFFTDDRFKKYAPHDFAIWTESYGGHYGPVFASYFLDMNAAITNGTATGTNINLKTLGIGNGLTDPLAQYAGYVTYALSNPYQPTVNLSTLAIGNNSWIMPGGCRDQISNCHNGGNDTVCSAAQEFCNPEVIGALSGGHDFYDVRVLSPNPYPPVLEPILTPEFGKKIGAEVPYMSDDEDVYMNFFYTGDWMRSTRPALETVINAGIRTIIYAGDADFIINYNGVENMVNSLKTKFSTAYAKKFWSTYNVAGQKAGQYKQVGTFSYLRVYGAGHEVPAYGNGKLEPGQAALQFFNQIMSNHSLSSTWSSASSTIESSTTTVSSTTTESSSSTSTTPTPIPGCTKPKCPLDLTGATGALITEKPTLFTCAYFVGSCTWYLPEGTLRNTAQPNCPKTVSC